jgi:hypothetical protein
MQVRFTWLGFVRDHDFGGEFEALAGRNGGIIAFSEKMASVAAARWAPEGWSEPLGKNVKATMHPALGCLTLQHSMTTLFDFGHRHLPLRLDAARYEALFWPPIALARETRLPFDVVVLSHCHTAGEGENLCESDVDAERLERAVLRMIRRWFESAKGKPPRVIMGNLGAQTALLAPLVTEVLGMHACWAGSGPEKTMLGPSHGGIWMVGPHAMSRGCCAEAPHEVLPSAYVANEGLMVLPAPRVVTLMQRVGYEVHVPTLCIGRSCVGRMKANQRPPPSRRH